MFNIVWRGLQKRFNRAIRGGSRGRRPRSKQHTRLRLEQLEDRTAPTADMGVTETGPSFAQTGNTVTYTVTLTNHGPNAASSVVLSDTLSSSPTSGVFVPGSFTIAPQVGNPDTFTPTVNSNGFTETANAAIPNGNTDAFIITAGIQLTAPDLSTDTNSASVSSSADPNPSNDNASVTTTLSHSTDFAVGKTGPGTATAGATITYTLTLTNTGGHPAVGVALTDTLPSGETLLTETQTGGPDTFTDKSAGSTVAFNAATVGSGNTNTFVVTALIDAKVAPGTTLTNTEVVAGANFPNRSSTLGTTITQATTLGLTKVGPDEATAGGFITYTLSLTNTGSTDATNVALTDTLPSDLTLLTETQTGGPDTFVDNSSGGTVTFNATTMGAGNTDTFVVTAQIDDDVSAGSVETNTADATADNIPEVVATSPDAIVATVADVSVTKTGPNLITAGTTVTYTVTLVNNGPSDALNVTLSDALPAGMTLVSESQVSGGAFFTDTTTGNTPSFNSAEVDGLVEFPGGNVNTFQIVASLPSNAANNTNLDDTATVTSDTPDSDLANNTFTFVSTGVTVADVGVTKTGPSTVIAGTTVTYTLTVSNAGPSDAQNVNVSDALPAGLTLVSESADPANPDTFTDTSTGNTPSFNAATVVSGNTDNFTVVAFVASSVPSGTNLDDTATVQSSSEDPNQSNNTFTFSSSVTTLADLDISVDPPFVTAGTNLTYTITLTNEGLSDAASVVITDTLPTGLTVLSAMQVTGPDSFVGSAPGGPTATFTATTMGAGNTDTFEVVVAVPSSTPENTILTDTATVTSATPDSSPGDETATTTTLVDTSADLSIVKNGPTTITAGTTITYTLTVHNAGPSDSQAVTVSDAVPTGLALLSESQVSGPDAFANTSAGNTASFFATTVPTGNTDVFQVIVSAPNSTLGGTMFTDTATVSSATTPDPDPTNNSSSVTTVAVASADLSVVKAGPLTITAGTDVTYTITIHNAGPSDAAGVTVTDTLPAGLTPLLVTAVNTNPDMFLPTGSTTVFAPTVLAGNTDIFQVVAAVPSGYLNPPQTLPPVATNTVTITSTTPDPILNNNTSTSTAPVAASADLAVTKTGPSQVGAGTTVTYTITVTNNGPSDSVGVVLSDTLPTLGTFVSITPSPSNLDNFGPFALVGGVLSNTSTTVIVGAGHSDVFTVVVAAGATLPIGSAFNDTAHVASTTVDPNLANNTATVTGTIVLTADVSVTKTGPTVVTAGTTVTYTITVTNAGPAVAASVTISDTLPVGLNLVSAAQASGGDFFVNTSTGNTASFVATTMAVGGLDTFVVVAKAPSSLPSGTPLSDIVTVTDNTPDPTLTDNTFTFGGVSATEADLSIVKTTPTPTATAGSPITYTLTVTNGGPSDAANVSITDNLPIGLTFVAEHQISGNDPFINNTTTNSVLLSAATMKSGNIDVFQIVATVSSNVGSGTMLTNTAMVSSSTLDLFPGNNTSTTTTPVTTSADLAVVKTGPTTATAGSNVTYTITVTNNGPSDAQTVTMMDALPTGLTRVSEVQITGPDGFVDVSTGNLVQFNIAALPALHTDVFQVVANAPSSDANGTLVADTATVSSVTPDSNPANNTSTVNTTITTVADLGVVKTGPGTVTAGTQTTYTITLTNAGPSNAANVLVSDTFPAGLTLVSATVLVNADSFTNTTVGGSTTATFNATTVGVGHTDVFQVILAAPASLPAGPLSDTATVTSSTFDNNLSNNTSTLSANLVTGADLSVVKTGPLFITAGQTFTYTITALNAGPSNATTVSLTDTLPTGVTLDSATAVNTNPDAFVSAGGGNFTATTMAAGNTDVFQLVVTAASNLANNTMITNTAHITSATPDPNLVNNTSSTTATITTSADLAVTKTGPTTVTAGTTVTYSITLTNNGPSDAQTVDLTDALPTGLNLVSEAQVSGPDNFINVSANNTATFTIATMPATHVDGFQVVAFAPASDANGLAIPETASVTSATPDSNLANNSATVNSVITTVANETVTLTGPTTATEGDTLTFTLTLTNNSPSDAQNVVLTDVLPAGLKLITAGNLGTTGATVSGQTITYKVGTLPANTTVTANIVVQAIEDGAQAQTATVTSSTPNLTGTTTATLTTNVAEPGINLSTIGIGGTETVELFSVPVATFTHANGVEGAGAFQASINWGDGTASPGTITQSGTLYTVFGTHTYNIDGSYTVTTTVTEAPTETTVGVSGTQTASIGELPLPGGVANTPQNNHMFELLDDLFNAEPSAFDINLLSTALLASELSAANQLMSSNSNIDAVTAFGLAQLLGQSQFDFFATIFAATAAPLDSSVNEMALAFLAIAQSESLGHGT
jgi:uncharacterized repeat protein (TIGR01451 family)